MDETQPPADDAAVAAAAAAAADTTTAPPPLEPTAPPARTRKVKARVLTPCAFGQPNDVLLLPAATVKAGKAAGELDDDEAGVAYAESLVSGPAA